MSRKGPEKPAKSATNADRKQMRLAKALRANLKRRKAVRLNSGKDTSGKPDGAED